MTTGTMLAMTRKRLTNFRLTPEVLADLTEAAARRGVSQAAIVEQALREYLAPILGRPVPPSAPRHRTTSSEVTDADDQPEPDPDDE